MHDSSIANKTGKLFKRGYALVVGKISTLGRISGSGSRKLWYEQLCELE